MTDNHVPNARDQPRSFVEDQRVGPTAAIVQTGIPIALPNAESVLKRAARGADRWLVMILALFLVALGTFLANPRIGIVPVVGSVVGVVMQQRKARRYLKAASLCRNGASCTLDVEDVLLVENGGSSMKLTLSLRMSQELHRQRLPAARATVRDP